MGDSIFN